MNVSLRMLCVAALATPLLLAGCGGQSTSGGSAARAERAGDAARGPGGRADKAVPGAGALAGEQPSKPRQESGVEQVRLAPSDRAIVYTASLTVRAGDVAAAVPRAKDIVTAAGGYVADEQTSTSPDGHGKDTTATLTLKVPAEHYQGVLDRLASDLGRRLELRQQAQDVTGEVADVDSRVRSARAALARMRELLAKAETIGEVLQVEAEIDRREADLEALEARQKALDAEVSYATVTLRLVSAPVPPRAKDDRPGFLAGLVAGWKAFRATASVLLTVLGAALPFLVALALTALAAWRGRGLLRRRRATVGPQE